MGRLCDGIVGEGDGWSMYRLMVGAGCFLLFRVHIYIGSVDAIGVFHDCNLACSTYQNSASVSPPGMALSQLVCSISVS